jgi:xanthine dehydrogenase accessory factor
MFDHIPVLILGAGDLASGVAARLHRSGFLVALTELEQPQAIRRTVAFAKVVYSGQASVEGIIARRVSGPDEARLA